MTKPTKTQRKILECMADGEELTRYGSSYSTRHYYVPGCPPPRQRTIGILERNKWIRRLPAIPGQPLVYEITEAGRNVIKREVAKPSKQMQLAL